MTLDTKKHIRTLVKAYIRQYPDEYAAVKEMIAGKRRMLWDDYASLEGLKETRALFEISETLQTVFIMELSPEETAEFSTITGSRWFAREFPEFALPQKI